MKITRRTALGAAAAALATTAWPARAAAFPDKPVKIAVGFAAGGGPTSSRAWWARRWA